ncbi:Uncharacterised protein [Neisseria meningitidis]|jgi:hypothetical protein|uniref:Uncharacterized protein n=3 Tax=Neisseria meningitidis TaxID=487 RepID=E0N7E2_NEIM3|nr:hypothetical protein [Neisseria meningitidis]ELL13511.1 hypothetical protein NM61103_1553 [Neisseria meningitidis 61103]EOB85131.1 hypothetical protein NM604_1646 [Neisseria meningitidis NM604]AHW76357.1 hypothetical protein NMA510612_2083 [Neisseria meningitidis]AOT29302.1 hypothetical protein AN159_05600 [Neisseria meningitidis]ARC06355.1 hypothetical protein A6J48_11110 [Neisseria meningitidis]
MKSIDLEISKLLDAGKYTPSEIQDLLEEQGFKISLKKLADHLDLLVAIGVAGKHSDDTFTSRLN